MPTRLPQAGYPVTLLVSFAFPGEVECTAIDPAIPSDVLREKAEKRKTKTGLPVQNFHRLAEFVATLVRTKMGPESEAPRSFEHRRESTHRQIFRSAYFARWRHGIKILEVRKNVEKSFYYTPVLKRSTRSAENPSCLDTRIDRSLNQPEREACVMGCRFPGRGFTTPSSRNCTPWIKYDYRGLFDRVSARQTGEPGEMNMSNCRIRYRPASMQGTGQVVRTEHVFGVGH